MKNKFKRIDSFFKENEWSLELFLLTIVALAFDTVGFKMMFEQNALQGNWDDFIYLSIRVFLFDLQTPSLDTKIPLELEIGRWLSATATVWAVMLTVKHIFEDELKLFRKGENHIVIIGAGSKGKTLGLDWMKKAKEDSNHKDHGKLFVFIDCDKNNTNVDMLKSNGAVVIFGDAKNEDILKKAKILNAEKLTIVTNSDSTNMEIVSTIVKMQKEQINTKTMSCYVHLIHNEFYDFFMAKDFDSKKLDVKIFNINTNAARILFGDKENLLGSNVFTDIAKIKDSSLKVKIAIFGFGKLGESILIHALHLGHFYNETPIEITVVYDMDKDENANVLDEFIKQYNIGIDKDKKKNTSFTDYWNIEFVDDGDFVKIADYSQLIIAYEDEFESLSNLMKLLKKYNDEILSNNIDIAIYSNSFVNTAGVIDRDKDKKENTVFKQVRTFGQIDKTCNYNIVINEDLDVKAKLNNKQYNELHGYDNKSKTADEEWHDLNMFLKDSNRYLIEHNEIKKYIIDRLIKSSTRNDYESIKKSVAEKYFNYKNMKINWDEMNLQNHDYAIKLSEEEIVQLGKVEHERWNAFHILNGWKVMSIDKLLDKTKDLSGHKQKDGKQKDKAKKLHACIVNWDDLDKVSEVIEHNYKSDDIETIMRIPSLENRVISEKQTNL